MSSAAQAPSGARPSASSTDLAPIDWRRLLPIAFALWTAVALFVEFQTYLYRMSLTPSPPARYGPWAALSSCWLWALLTPALFSLARRFPIERGRVLVHAGLHLLFALGLSLLDVLVDWPLWRLLGVAQREGIVTMYFAQLFSNSFSYGAVIAVAHAITYYRLYHERRMQASRLESDLLRAELKALEMQLRPHFLFNVLHTVSGLIRIGQHQAAIKMIAGLGELLRAVLRQGGEQEIPLAEELDFIRRYLGLQQLRFQDQLRVSVAVAPGLDSALVPRMLLQPLVENAIEHGIGSAARAGEVEICVTEEDGALCLRVCDSGEGRREGRHRRPEAGAGESGIGLGNTRARLGHLYGERHRLVLEHTAEGGTQVLVSLPLRRPPAAEKAA